MSKKSSETISDTIKRAEAMLERAKQIPEGLVKLSKFKENLENVKNEVPDSLRALRICMSSLTGNGKGSLPSVETTYMNSKEEIDVLSKTLSDLSEQTKTIRKPSPLVSKDLKRRYDSALRYLKRYTDNITTGALLECKSFVQDWEADLKHLKEQPSADTEYLKGLPLSRFIDVLRSWESKFKRFQENKQLEADVVHAYTEFLRSLRDLQTLSEKGSCEKEGCDVLPAKRCFEAMFALYKAPPGCSICGDGVVCDMFPGDVCSSHYYLNQLNPRIQNIKPRIRYIDADSQQNEELQKHIQRIKKAESIDASNLIETAVIKSLEESISFLDAALPKENTKQISSDSSSSSSDSSSSSIDNEEEEHVVATEDSAASRKRPRDDDEWHKDALSHVIEHGRDFKETKRLLIMIRDGARDLFNTATNNAIESGSVRYAVIATVLTDGESFCESVHAKYEDAFDAKQANTQYITRKVVTIPYRT